MCYTVRSPMKQRALICRASVALAAGLWALLSLLGPAAAGNRTFTIENDRFVRDGKPVQLISGS